MPKQIAKQTDYRSILVDIEDIYLRAQEVILQMRWLVGRRVVEAEQGRAQRAPYAEGLISRLSRDLTARFGKGFSPTNIKDMRRFYLAHKKSRHVVQLTWHDHIALLAVKDPKKRQQLEERAFKEDLSRDEIRALIRRETAAADENEIITQLAFTRGTLDAFEVIKDDDPERNGGLVLDFGFRQTVPLPDTGSFNEGDIVQIARDKQRRVAAKIGLTKDSIYTYKAQVMRVIDGDTLLVRIGVEFGIVVRWKLRLRGIDCPEMDTPEGRKAKRFVQAQLNGCNFIIAKTYKDRPDKYDRYLTDVFYTKSETNPQIVADHGDFLNQKLLDNSLARVVK